MKKFLLITFIFIAIIANAQLKVLSNGEVRLWTNTAGQWDQSFVTFTNEPLSKAYIVQRGNDQNFFVRGDGFIYARGVYINSDARIKTNVQSLTDINRLLKLRPISYNFVDSSNSETSLRLKKAPGDSLIYTSDKNILKQYGFIAQELSCFFPELVNSDENGLLRVNYIEFVPLLLAAIQKQQSEIDELKEMIANCCHPDIKSINSSSLTPLNLHDNLSEHARLYENVPNPFSVNTRIEYEIPSNVYSANLIIYNLQGSEIKSFAINQMGSGFVMIQAYEFKAGMYFYSLLIDNKIIDTKRMVLTNK